MTETRIEGGLEEPDEFQTDSESLTLAAPEDARHGRAEWERAAAEVLRKSRRLGEDDVDDLVWDRLARTTLDGIRVTPLGTPDQVGDLSAAVRPERSEAWDVRPLLTAGEAVTAHDEAITDLENGATSLWLRVLPDTDLDVLLDGVLLDVAAVVLDCPEDPVGAARTFLARAGEVTLHPATNLGIPTETLSGLSPDHVVELSDLARNAGVLGFVVDAAAVHDRGASDVQELAASIAAGTAYLRSMEAAGLDVASAAGLVEFRYAATDEQFPTIAKLRAARRLWARVLEVSTGSTGSSARMRQHAVTSRPMMSTVDPYVNMLRTTVAAFAAGVGGADAVTVLPFDSPLGRPEAFGRRIARNTSSLLIAESHVARVADPAGGSYAVEKLTDDLARAAWDLFTQLDGGHDLEPLIEATVAERERQVATRNRPLTGVTEFPDPFTAVPQRRPDPLLPEVRRHGAAFEALQADPTGPVFLATLGTVAQHTARATFATNLLAAGGVPVEPAGATAGVEDLLAAYSGQPVVCLAGADAAYGDWGAEAAAGLREAGAVWVVVAGQPREWADDSCAMGLDALDFLTRTREKLS